MGALSTTDESSSLKEPQTKEVGVNTNASDDELSKLTAKVVELEEELSTLRKQKGCGVTNFRLKAIADDDFKVAFYTQVFHHMHI